MKLNNNWLFIALLMTLSVILLSSGTAIASRDCIACHDADSVASSVAPEHFGDITSMAAPDPIASAVFAKFNWYQGDDCYEVAFDATVNNLNCTWDFDSENSAADAETTQCVTSWIFADAGTKPVTLTTDDGADTQGTRTMSVTAKAVSALPTTARTVAENNMDLTVTDTTVTSGSCGVTTVAVAVVGWGDGTTSVQSISLGGSDTIGPHTYGVNGTYTMSYCVTDSNGKKDCADAETFVVPNTTSSVCTLSGTACVDGDNPGNGCDDVGTCDDPAYGDQEFCEYDGVCSNALEFYASTCDAFFCSVLPATNTTEALCTLAAGTWAAGVWTPTNTWTAGVDTAIRNARINVNLAGTGTLKKMGATGQDGTYSIPNVQVGTYDIVASKNGYAFTDITGLVLDCDGDETSNTITGESSY